MVYFLLIPIDLPICSPLNGNLLLFWLPEIEAKVKLWIHNYTNWLTHSSKSESNKVKELWKVCMPFGH
ncbi:hypothetical protein HUJ05_013071 [Dendroctonus ponderosae]|nr:hypothetical protein HUJ05_013071 [Dendroctonus ponderosae]